MIKNKSDEKQKRPCDLGKTLNRWIDRHRSRKQLVQLTDSELKDIGLTRGMAVWEANKPFWKK